MAVGMAISGHGLDEPLRGRIAAAVDLWLPRRRDGHGRGYPGQVGWGSRRWALGPPLAPQPVGFSLAEDPVRRTVTGTWRRYRHRHRWTRRGSETG